MGKSIPFQARERLADGASTLARRRILGRDQVYGDILSGADSGIPKVPKASTPSRASPCRARRGRARKVGPEAEDRTLVCQLRFRCDGPIIPISLHGERLQSILSIYRAFMRPCGRIHVPIMVVRCKVSSSHCPRENKSQKRSDCANARPSRPSRRQVSWIGGHVEMLRSYL